MFSKKHWLYVRSYHIMDAAVHAEHIAIPPQAKKKMQLKTSAMILQTKPPVATPAFSGTLRPNAPKITPSNARIKPTSHAPGIKPHMSATIPKTKDATPTFFPPCFKIRKHSAFVQLSFSSSKKRCMNAKRPCAPSASVIRLILYRIFRYMSIPQISA